MLHLSHSNMELQKTKGITAKSVEKVDFDQLLSSAGTFGIYQVFLVFISFPFYFFGVFSYFSQIFLTQVSPNHWCWIQELENLTDIDRRNIAIPPDPGTKFGYSHCLAYRANWTDVLNSGHRPNHTWPTMPCPNSWEFNQTEIPYATIASELGWVCERSSYQATAQSFFFVGSIFGGLLFGWVADRYGRLASAVGSNFLGCVAGVVTVYTRNFMQFTLCRFFAGMAYDNCMMMVYLLVMEYVAPKYRTMIGNITSGIFYTLGMISLPWIALSCNEWKMFGLLTSIPMGLALLAPLAIPESPRWLLSKDRADDALSKVSTIARINKKIIPTELIDNFKANANNYNEEENTNILEVFKRPILRRVFMCMCITYMCNMIGFDGLVRSIGVLPFDFFLSFSITSFTELPSLLLVALLTDVTGRKWLTIVSLIICCLTSIVTSFSGGYVSLICVIIARLTVNMACYVTIQWTMEVLPISVRGSGISIVHICGYIGTVISPYIVYLETFVSGLPLIIIGCSAAVGASSGFFIPDTTARGMPQSFEEAEDIIKSQEIFDIPCKNKRKINSNKGHINNDFELD